MTADGKWDLTEPASRGLTDAERRATRLYADDLLMTKSSGSALHLGKTALVTPAIEEMGCCFSNFMQRLRVSAGLNPRYLYWFLNSSLAREQFNYYGTTSTGLANLSASLIGGLRLAIPGIDCQIAIADRLDRSIPRLDEVAFEYRRIAELVDARRPAAIAEALLGRSSRDPSLPMHEWASGFARSDAMLPLGHCVIRATYGFTNPMPTESDGPYMLTANDIGDGRIDYENARRTSEQAFAQAITDKARPLKGDVLLTKDGTLGRVAVADGRRVCINQSVALVRPMARLDSDYLAALLRSAPYQEVMNHHAGGTTIKHIYVTRIVKMPIPLVDLSDQSEGVAAVSVIDQRTDALMGDLVRQIRLMEERRQALIADAVSGRLDVSAEAA